MTTLETPRLTLRPYTKADIPQLVLLLSAREVAAMTLRIAHPYTEKHAKDFIAKADTLDETNDEVRRAITLRADGVLCGGVGLRLEPEHHHAELGYWIGIPYWGHGYATEAAQAMVRHGFETMKLHRIAATCMTHNPASARILTKLGMRHEGCLRQHQNKWGKFLDVECYGILRSEWETRAAE